MVPTNDFLPFCPTDTGTNLESQSDYAVDTNRTNGNQPGVASSKLNNKALRQGTYIASQFAQFLANTTNTDILDNDVPAQLLAQINSALQIFPPNITVLTSGTGTFNPAYLFQIASGNATSGATYTNNGITYTVVDTISSGTLLKATGSGAPTSSGTLTKASGTGDSTLTFYAARSAAYLHVRAVGGGGGGGASGTGSGGSNGGDTTFGTSLLVANGGVFGSGASGGGGGGHSLGSASGIGLTGAAGQGGLQTTVTNVIPAGGNGGSSPFGGAGQGSTSTGGNAQANTGSGGGGAEGNATNAGGGGGAGGYVDAFIFSPLSTYAYAVGAGGTGQTGTALNGGNGGSGIIYIEEHYQ